ncbi:MAG: glycosyltransferase family 1 protein [Alphaproteobacteria bacterium]
MNALSARRGGIFTYTLNLAKSIDDNEIDVCIGAPPHLASTIGPGSLTIDVSHMGPIRRLAWEQSVWRKIVKRESPDVLFSSANFALFASSVPQLLLMREGGLFNPYYLKSVFPQLGLRARMATVLRRQIMLYSVRSATRVMFPSESLRDWVADWEPSIAETGIINHYGIDLSRFTMGQDRPPLDRNRIKLLYVSVYYPHKDPCTLSRAVDALRDSGIGADATITMAEQEFDLWYSGRTDYEELTQSEQRGRVTLGSVDYDNLTEIYKTSSIFCFPSLSETFGFPLVEAMACGLPIVAADTTINREICGPIALYHTPGDPESLAARIRELIDRPCLYRWLSSEGRKRVEKNFDWRQHLGNMVEILKEMGTGRS